MNNKTKIVILASSFSLCVLTAGADKKEDMFNPVNTAVTSQTIAPDARAGSMGDVGAATDPDVNSQYWNPAKYPFNISRAGVSINYTPWLRQLVNDIDLAQLVGYYRIGDYSAVSASLRYFSLGEVQLSESEKALTINPYEMSLDVAYSLMSTPILLTTTPTKPHRPRLLQPTSPATIRTISISVRASVSWDWV